MCAVMQPGALSGGNSSGAPFEASGVVTKHGQPCGYVRRGGGGGAGGGSFQVGRVRAISGEARMVPTVGDLPIRCARSLLRTLASTCMSGKS